MEEKQISIDQLYNAWKAEQPIAEVKRLAVQAIEVLSKDIEALKEENKRLKEQLGEPAEVVNEETNAN